MNHRIIAAIALASSLGGVAQAQETVHWAMPSGAPVQQSYFPIGTPLTLTTRAELNTRYNRAGERFYLEVAEPLVYRDEVVVPKGSLAVGEIARSEGNAAFGKHGSLGLRLLYVQTPYGTIRLTGQTTRDGEGQGLLAIGGGILVAWPMFFIRGRSGVLPANSVVTAQLIDDLRFGVLPGGYRSAAAGAPAVASR